MSKYERAKNVIKAWWKSKKKKYIKSKSRALIYLCLCMQLLYSPGPLKKKEVEVCYCIYIINLLCTKLRKTNNYVEYYCNNSQVSNEFK